MKIVYVQELKNLQVEYMRDYLCKILGPQEEGNVLVKTACTPVESVQN
jgi:hypothetical protein